MWGSRQSRCSRWFRAALWIPVASLSFPGSLLAGAPPGPLPQGARATRTRPLVEAKPDASVVPAVPDVRSTAASAAAPRGVSGGVVAVRSLPTSPRPKSLEGRRFHTQGEFVQDQPGSEGGAADSLPAPKQLLFDPERPVPEGAAKAPAEGDAPRAPGGFVQQWTGLSNTGWIPPDTIHAVGPSHVVEAVNSGFAIYTKFGTEVQGYTVFEDLLNEPAGWNGFMFDPRIVYDATHAKFVMLVLGRDDNAVQSYFWLAVSQTSDPTGDWWVWRFNSTDTTGTSAAWLDYAGLAADSWGVYVTGNFFYFTGGYRGSNLWSINPDIFNGGATNGWRFWDLRWPSGAQAFAIQPAHPHSINASQQTFFVNTFSGSGSEVLLWKMSGDRTNAPTLTSVAIGTAGYEAIGMNVDQPGSATDIDGGDARVMNAVYSQSRVFFTLTDDVNNNGDAAGWLTVKINVNANTNEWQHLLWGGVGFYYFYPAITILGGSSADANLAVFGSWTETASAPGQFASGLYKIYDDQPAATTGPFVSHSAGLAAYVALDNSGRNRWGDYSGAGYDWQCGHAWGAVEAADTGNDWRTTIAARQFGTEPVCPAIEVTDPNGGEVWNAGTNHLITWLRQGLGAANDLYIYYNDGASNHLVAGPVSTGLSSFNWQVPGIPSSTAKIFVGSWTGSSYEASDWSDLTFRVTAPDLRVINPTVNKTLFAPGEGFSLGATVNNQGNGSSNVGTTLRYLLSTDATITTADAPIGTDPIGVLGAGASSIQAAAPTAPAAPGNYWVGACVDAVAGESSTANQCSAGVAITVTQPDLVVSAIDAPATAGAGGAISVANTVRNQGTVQTLIGFRTGLYYSEDAVCNSSDILIGTRAVGALAPGATSAANSAVTVPATATVGTRYICAVADDLSQVGETNEANNVGTDSIEILPATPTITLKVNGSHPTPPEVTVSGPTLVTLDVSASAYTNTVDWYWAIVYNGSLFWVTSGGISPTPAPWFSAPPVALSNVTLLNLNLPPGTTMTNFVFMLDGTTTVAFDFITAIRP